MPPGSGTDASGGSSSEGDAIKVFVRVRPPMDGEEKSQMCLTVDNSRNAIIMQSKPDPKVFTFDEVADINTTQESVFCSVAKKLMDSCLDGYNGTIFAYGQTGSGKTFTMLGPAEGSEVFQHELRGIIPRSFEYVFKLIQREQEMQGDKVQFLCKCSFLEIYNEQVYDLLDPTSVGLHIRENMKRGVFVDGLIEEAVANASDAYQVLSSGWLNRTVASTSMNRESSRSHAVFTLHIESKINKGGIWNIKSSQLNLVDLAGSERQKDTKTVGARLKEAGNINKSLSALGNVIMALVDIAHGKSRHVPYRDSKLSFLLRDSLGGNAKTFIIACAHPSSKCFGESLSTLQFARRAKMIKNKAVVNEDTHGNLLLLQAEIRRLKETLSQYQQGSVQPVLPAHGQTDSVSPTMSEEDIQWKKRFFKAMFFREQILNEKKILEEKYQGLLRVSQRQELSIQQSRMVIKFRDEALKRFDKARKAKTELDQDDKDVVIDTLRKEVVALQEMVDHHPNVAKYKMENSGLRAELKKLQGQKPSEGVTIESTVELEREYRELAAEQDAKGEEPVATYNTPQQSVETQVAVATLERHKSQIEKLQAELEKVKREMGEKEQQYQSTIMEQQAKVKSLQDGKKELERLLRAHYVAARIERETQEEMTVETLKNITTPKRNLKTLYNLRTRAVEISGDESPLDPVKLNLDDSVEGGDPDEMLSGMTIPEEFKDVTIEALNDLIKKLQEKNRNARSQFDAQDCQMVKLVEDNSRNESQLQQLRELYDKEKTTWKTVEQELRSSAELAQENSKKLTERSTLLVSEVEDWRVQSEYTYKQLQELKSREKQLREEKEHEIGLLETKNLKKDMELVQLHKELDSAMEEQERLTDHAENLQDTLGYTEEKAAEGQRQLDEAREEYQELVKTHQMLLSQQENLQKSNQQLMRRLEEQGDKEKQLMEALQDAQKLRHNLEQRQNMLEALEHTKSILNEELEKERCEKERLERACQDNKEAMNALTQRLADQRESLQQAEHDREESSAELKELQQKLYHAESESERLHQTVTETQAAAQRDATDLRVKLAQETASAAVVQEDLESVLQQLTTVTELMQTEQKKTEELKQEKVTLEEDAMQLKAQISNLELSVNEFRGKLDAVRREQEETSLKQEDELQSNMLTLQRQLEERDQKLSSLHQAFNDVSSQLDSREATISRVEEQLEKVTASRGEWENKCNSQESQAEWEKSEWIEKERCLKEDLLGISSRAEEADSAVVAAIQEKQQALAEKNWLGEENIGLKEELCSISAEKQDMLVDVERLKEALKNKDQNLVDVISKYQELEEQFLQKEKKLKEQETKLTEQDQELIKLAGHQNINQKIHYVHQMKLQNVQLVEQIKQLEKDNGQLHKRIGDLEEITLVLGSTPGRDAARNPAHREKTASKELFNTPLTPNSSTPKSHNTPQRVENKHLQTATRTPSKENMKPLA